MTRKLSPLAALATVALIGVGCSDEPAESGNAANAKAGQEQAMRFAECMPRRGRAASPRPS
jgi:hypothetical protein